MEIIEEIRKEIDRIEEEARKVRVSGTDKEAIGADGKVRLCLKLKSLIESLQQEQPKVILLNRDTEDVFAREYAIYSLPPFVVESIAYGTQLIDFIYKTAHHFYERGFRRAAEMYDETEYNRQRAEED